MSARAKSRTGAPRQARSADLQHKSKRSHPATPALTAKALGLNLADGCEGDWFKWLIACFLAGKRIQSQVALRAYRVVVEQHRLDSPQKILDCNWQRLVEILDEGHYARYDESTAGRLHGLCRKLMEDYDGHMTGLRDASHSPSELKRRLMEFKGIGTKTAEIFLREARPAWFSRSGH